jgi:cytochrome o ubiquinol oxidase subunit 2
MTTLPRKRLAVGGYLRLATTAWLLALGGCSLGQHGFLHAQGPVAGDTRHLFAIVCVILLFVAGPVLLLTPIFAWHYRLSNSASAFRPKWNFSRTLEFFIWIPPAAIVIGLGALAWNYTHRLDPYRPIAGAGAPLEIEVVALDWKWLFIYPGEHMATINQLVIPAGRPVHLRLTSGTVMQSLLIPELAGQIYAMPGMTTQLNFAADRPGVYPGRNTQYDGNGFAGQRFTVVALPTAQYDHWAARTAAAPAMTRADYNRLFVRAGAAAPVTYAGVPDDLYARILARSNGNAMTRQ